MTKNVRCDTVTLKNRVKKAEGSFFYNRSIRFQKFLILKLISQYIQLNHNNGMMQQLTTFSYTY